MRGSSTSYICCGRSQPAVRCDNAGTRDDQLWNAVASAVRSRLLFKYADANWHLHRRRIYSLSAPKIALMHRSSGSCVSLWNPQCRFCGYIKKNKKTCYLIPKYFDFKELSKNFILATSVGCVQKNAILESHFFMMFIIYPQHKILKKQCHILFPRIILRAVIFKYSYVNSIEVYLGAGQRHIQLKHRAAFKRDATIKTATVHRYSFSSKSCYISELSGHREPASHSRGN